MKYFTSEITDNVNPATFEEYKKRAESYKEEYQKVRKKLPKEFTNIYESHDYFHDVLVPEISILSDYSKLINNNFRTKRTVSIIKMAVIDYDIKHFALMLTFEDIKKISIRTQQGEFTGLTEDMIYNELLPDDGYISWEMVFASESNIKFVFKKLKVRDLRDAEMKKYLGKE